MNASFAASTGCARMRGRFSSLCYDPVRDFAPAGTPAQLLSRLHPAITKALSESEVDERIVADGPEAAGSTTEQFSDYIKRDIPKWAKVIKESGARAD